MTFFSSPSFALMIKRKKTGSNVFFHVRQLSLSLCFSFFDQQAACVTMHKLLVNENYV